MTTFAFAVCELHLPEARSLKEKRKVVRSLIDRIHRRCRVSVAETGYHDLHQRAEISVAAVHGDGRELDRLMASILRAMVLAWRPELHRESGR